MASTYHSVVVLALIAIFLPCIAPWSDDDCKSYTDLSGKYIPKKTCNFGFCCGSCYNRYCCQDSFFRLTEDKQEDCDTYEYTSRPPFVPMVLGIGAFVFIALIFILCCVCPCCCLYKACRRPRPVIATTTHTTVISSTPQSYPQQPTAVPQGPYQGAQYPAYQPVPVQPGYGAQPMPYQGAPYTPGPPPTYQEATGPAYPVAPMPYSQAAFTPGQPSYPLQPPVQSPAQPCPQPQPSVPPPQMDFLSQPAYNPDYVPNKM